MSSLETDPWSCIKGRCLAYFGDNTPLLPTWFQRERCWKQGPKYSRCTAHTEGLVKATGWVLGDRGRRKWCKSTHCAAALKARSTCQLPYICQVLRRPCWWRGNWGIPQGSELGQRSLLVETEAGWKHLRRRISRCFRTYQVYRAARFWVFIGVPLLRCWERCDWFRPVTSTTSLWGMLCCCM